MDFSSPSFTLTDSSGAMSGGATGPTSPGTIYSYTAPVTGGYDAAGNLKSSTDLVMGAWNYTYDTLNRLQAGTPTSGLYETPTAQYACFAYDSFGNRKAGALQTTACPTPETSVPSTVTYSATNQVTFVSGSLPLGLSYDGAGNVTSDGLNYYAYDGEGRLCAVENTLVDSYTQYVYDAGGTRVAKGASASLTCGAPGSNFSLTNQYLVGLGGEQVTELDGWGDWLHTDVWAGGRLLATYDGFGIHFPLTDPLGTKRIQANAYGAVDETCFSLPYGDGLNCIGDDATEHHFTGKERDTESGNDYFEARYYSSAMGRFMSPDWSAKEEPIPYATMDDPQSLNLYAYVRNNPLARTDPDGHCCEEVQQWADQTGLEPVMAGAAVAQGLVTVWMNRDQIADTITDIAKAYANAGGPYSTGMYPTTPIFNSDATDRGRANEGKGLAEVGATKNTTPSTTTDPKTGKEVTTIPDGKMPDGQHVEVKDTNVVRSTPQIRGQGQASVAESGKKPILVTGDKTKVSKSVDAAKGGTHIVVRTPKLGPQQ
jgi:RHS repeat-associated protein